jgi:hypothetical protein
MDKDSGVYARKQKDCLVARFDSAQILAVTHKHETHERTLCNITKRGEALMARLAQLDLEATELIARSKGSWDMTHVSAQWQW